jgi:hypothetical protein
MLASVMHMIIIEDMHSHAPTIYTGILRKIRQGKVYLMRMGCREGASPQGRQGSPK